MSRQIQITTDFVRGDRVTSLNNRRIVSLSTSNLSASCGNLSKLGDKSPVSGGREWATVSGGGDAEPDSRCICERPKTKVFCRNCGFFREDARVRSKCLVHPQIFYLLDLESCPRCCGIGVLQEVCPYNPETEWMNHPVFNQEFPVKTEEDPTSPDASKNFFKRPLLSSSSGTALSTLSTNVTRGNSNYRYAHGGNRKPNQGSYLKRKHPN